MLRREIWTLRDEYDRLDKILQDHRTLKENHKHNNNNKIKNSNELNDESGGTSDSSEVG